MVKFKFGDKVKVSPKSKYFDSQGKFGEGIIVNILKGDLWDYEVDFKEQKGFMYNDIDLVENRILSWKKEMGPD